MQLLWRRLLAGVGLLLVVGAVLAAIWHSLAALPTSLPLGLGLIAIYLVFAVRLWVSAPPSLVITGVWLGLIALTATYSAVALREESQAWGWFHSLIATLVAAVAALRISLLQVTHQSRLNDRSRRKQYEALLEVELQDILDTLNAQSDLRLPVRTKAGPLHLLHLPYLQPLILEDAARSGLFEPDATRRMVVLCRAIRAYHWQADQFVASLGLQSNQEVVATHALTYLRDCPANLKSQVNGLATVLHLKFIESHDCPGAAEGKQKVDTI